MYSLIKIQLQTHKSNSFGQRKLERVSWLFSHRSLTSKEISVFLFFSPWGLLLLIIFCIFQEKEKVTLNLDGKEETYEKSTGDGGGSGEEKVNGGGRKKHL